MPLLDRQRQGVTVGAIRIGQQVPTGKDGKMRPAKLDTFRLTSPDREKIIAAADLYGGEVRPWKPSDSAAGQWEVITTTDRLPVRVPPGTPVTQDYMLFAGRPVVRQRLCDGVRERMKGTPCICPADLGDREEAAKNGNACRPTTTLSVILAQVPGLGVWTLTSRGNAAADELAVTAQMLQAAEVQGVMLPAVLRLEQRRGVGSGEVRQFAVPVLDVAASLAALESGNYERAGITAAAQTALPPAPPRSDAPALPPPVGAPNSAEVLYARAKASTNPDEVKMLKRLAHQRGWHEDFLDGPDGVSERLENLLYDRYLAIGGQP